MTENRQWKPQVSLDDLDSRLENAYRRVSGVLGYDISFDHGRSRSMKDTAAQMLDAGLETPGPAFMRMGRGLLEARGLKTGPGLALRDMAGEILREFHNEGNTAYLTVKTALYADAREFLEESGLPAGQTDKILEAADEVYLPPSKEAFTQAAKPFCAQKLTPFGLAAICGLLAFGAVIALLRVPHLAIIGALLAGGLGFYVGRNRQRAAARALLQGLPRALYDILRTGLRSNIERYADVLNSALSRASRPE